MQRLLLPQTALLLESRSGKTGFEFLPYVALLAQQHTYLTQLFWSGNWQYYIRRNPQGRVVLAGGLNPWGLRIPSRRTTRSRCPICCSAAWRATSTRPHN